MVASPAGSAPWSAPALTSSAAVVAGITHSLLLTLQLAASPDEPNYFAAPGAPAPATPAVRWPEALTLATANLATLATVQFATHRWTGARGPWPGASSRMQSFGVAACVATAALAYHVALTTVHPSIVFLVGLLALQSTCAKSSSKYHHVADHDDKDEHWTAHAASDVAYPAWTRWALVLSTVILVAVYWPVHPIQAAVSLSVLIFSILATPYFASRANHDRDVAPTPLVTAAVLLVLPLFGTGIPASLPVGHLAATALAAAVATASPSSTLPHALSVPAVVTAAWSAPFASAPIARAALAVALTLVVAATTRSRLEPATAPSSSPRDQIPLSDAADAVVDADSDSIDTLPRPATASRLASTPVVPLLAAAVLAFAAFVLLGLTASVVPTTAPGDYRAVIRPAARDPCADLSFTRKEPVPVVNATTALVTGGSGFIGSHLVEKLLALGYKVRILDNLATGYLHNIAHLVTHANVEFVYGDIMDQDTILQAVQGVDYVYHLAAMSKVAPSMKDPAMARFCLDTNVGGTVNVLNASRIAGVKKVVYAASSTYYGNGKVPMNEVDPPNLLTPYSATKYEGEIQMDLYDRIFNLPTIAVRFFMVYGPRQPTTGAYAIVTGVFLKKWMDHQPLPIEGDGSHYRDFIHARDITKALILAQQSPHRAMVVNAGTGVGHSVHEVADLVSPDHTHVAPRRNDLVGTLADTCKAKKVLGFEADYEFTHEMTGLIHDAADPVAYLAKPEVQNTVVAHLAHPWLLPPGLLKAKYAPLVNDLPALAAVQAREMQLTVIPYHASSRALLENAVYSLVKHGQAPHFLVAAEDAGSLTSCLAMNLPCYNATLEGAQWVLPRVTSALLDLGYTVHAASIDASYVRAVWPSYTAWLDSVDAEMAGQYEPTGSVSAVNYIVRPTEPARNFFRTLLSTSGSPARAFATAFKAHASLCQSPTACAALTRSGKLAVRDFSSIHGRSAPCAGDAVIDVCTRATAAFIDPACANGVAAKAHKLAKLGAWFMREVCPAGAGDDPALRKHECMGVPAALLSRRSAGLPDAKARPATVENECMGKVAALTAQ